MHEEFMQRAIALSREKMRADEGGIDRVPY